MCVWLTPASQLRCLGAAVAGGAAECHQTTARHHVIECPLHVLEILKVNEHGKEYDFLDGIGCFGG